MAHSARGRSRFSRKTGHVKLDMPMGIQGGMLSGHYTFKSEAQGSITGRKAGDGLVGWVGGREGEREKKRGSHRKRETYTEKERKTHPKHS
jgi:hypothetical protein